MSGSRPKYLALLCACLLATNSSHAIAAPSKDKDLDERSGLHRYPKENVPGTAMTTDALAIAKMLKIDHTLEELKAIVKTPGAEPPADQRTDVMYLRQKCARATQYASLELEEALANIDGDLTYTNLEYSLFSAKHERSVNLNNAATFLTSGTLGVIDSASGIIYGAPTPNIFGITGNAAAVAIPLWGLRPRKYKSINPNAGNMLAPIFDLDYEGVGYDPIIWAYLNSAPAGDKSNTPRKQMLLMRWKKFRHYDADTAKGKEDIERLAGVSQNKAVTLDLLKTRAELLVELRAQVQAMYADLSDLNTEIMKY